MVLQGPSSSFPSSQHHRTGGCFYFPLLDITLAFVLPLCMFLSPLCPLCVMLSSRPCSYPLYLRSLQAAFDELLDSIKPPFDRHSALLYLSAENLSMYNHRMAAVLHQTYYVRFLCFLIFFNLFIYLFG